MESAVQANRQIVEGAQRCHFKNSAWQRRQLAAELDVWKEDYFDTAIWLYHLVFGLNSPDSSTKNAASTYHNLVADSTSTDSQDPFLYIEPYSISHSTHSDSYDKTMIVWNRETEPSSVVDRLLFTWTKLTADQIMQSSICGDNDAWSKSFVKMVADAKIEEDQEKAEYLTERKQQGGYESPNDEESAIAEEVPYQEYPTETHQTVQRHPTYYGEYSNPFIYTHNRSLGTADNNSFQSTIHEAGDLELGTRERRARKPNTTSSTGSQITYDQKERQELPHGKVRWETNELPAERSQEHATSSRKYWEHSTLENRPTSSKKSTYQAHIDDTEQYPMQSDSGIGYGNDSTRDQYHRSSTRNPGKSSRSTSHHKRDEKPNIHIHLNTTQPGKDSPDRGEDDSSSSKTPMAFAHDIARSQPYPAGVSPNSREDSILTAMKCLSDAQQEQYAWLERREARLIAEVEKKDAQAAREKDQGKIRKLESLLIQQKEEQQKAQAVWGAERAALEEKAARRAQEVKDVAEKQVTAASLAKEAAQNALEALKADVERRNKEEADAKAVEARKRVEEQYKALLQRYEEQIETLKNSKPAGTSHRQSDRPHPVRRTHMSNGSRSIEVAEYTTDHLEPLGGSHFAALNISQEELYKSIFNSKENTESWENSDLSNSFSGSATREQFPQRLDGSINSTTERSQQNRQMILFPSKTSRNSTRTCELRMSLAKHGVNVEFEDPNNETHNELARYDCSRGEIVRSTLFWEPPVLRSGSELLATMRRVGWRPSYIRASGNKSGQKVKFLFFFAPSLIKSSVTGQTHYFGDQPVHLYFFQPDYKPQLTPWVGHVLSERLIIHKGLVEESVIQDFGFPYHLSQQDAYILHGHVTHVSWICKFQSRKLTLTRAGRHRSSYRAIVFRERNAVSKKPTPFTVRGSEPF